MEFVKAETRINVRNDVRAYTTKPKRCMCYRCLPSTDKDDWTATKIPQTAIACPVIALHCTEKKCTMNINSDIIKAWLNVGGGWVQPSEDFVQSLAGCRAHASIRQSSILICAFLKEKLVRKLGKSKMVDNAIGNIP